MPKSMTGFGRGEHLSHDRRFKVEIKSVNHRYGDFYIKLPRFLNLFEDRVRKRLARDNIRGKVEVWVGFESFTEKDMAVRVNHAFADAYVRALREVAERYGLPDSPTLALLAAQHDIVSVERNEVSDEDVQREMWEVLSCALEQALAGFHAMRETEGQALAQDIREKQKIIRENMERIKARAPLIGEEYTKRLHERIHDMLEPHGLTADEGRVLTEVAVFAERACVDEEITRLESHLNQLTDILREPDAIGRKLDFLVQELNREINTIGAKSNDTELGTLVVAVKGEIEKMREQVQNLE